MQKITTELFFNKLKPSYAILALAIVFAIVIMVIPNFTQNKISSENNLASLSSCQQMATISVKTDKSTYKTGETVDGKIIFTNKTGSEGNVSFTGNIYRNNQVILGTQTITVLIKTGRTEAKLSDLFGRIVIPSGYNGSFKVKISASITGCVWNAETRFSVKSEECQITANANVHQDTYTFGETITGEITVNNRGQQVQADTTVNLYKDNTLFWTRTANLPIQAGETKFDLNTAFGFVPTLPTDPNLVGNWKLEFTLKSSACDLKVSDGFGVKVVGGDLPPGYTRYTLPSGSTAVYPIVTHYTPCGGNCEAGDCFNMFGSSSDTCIFKPSYEHYPAYNTDSDAPTGDQVLQFITAVEETTGHKVIVENYFGEKYLNAKENIDKVQIINNVLLRKQDGFERDGTSLFTIVLPPNWQRNSVGKYPIVLSGNGYGTGNNRQRIQLSAIGELPALKELPEGKGYIVVYSNAGGAHNMGASDNTLRDVSDILGYVSERFNGDKYQVINIGGSRGGMTAMLWAANPKGFDYQSIGVFAVAPPTNLGTEALLPIANYPTLGNFYSGVMDDNNAWNYLFNLVWGIEPLQIIKPYFNTDKAEIGDLRGVYGNLVGLKKLSDKGYPIIVDSGTFDNVVPFSLFLKVERKMQELGIIHSTNIVYNTGHDISGDRINSKAQEYLLHILDNGKFSIEEEREYFIRDTFHPTNSEFNAKLPVNELPLSINIPFTFAKNIPRTTAPFFEMEPAWVIVCGKDGFKETTKISQYFVDDKINLEGEFDYCPLYDPQKYKMVNYELNKIKQDKIIFDDEECIAFKLSKEDFPQTGKYCWAFETDGKKISPYNTPFAWDTNRPLRAVTFVTDSQIHPSVIQDTRCKNLGVGDLCSNARTFGVYEIPTCGNNQCEKQFTENKWTCPEDCSN